MATKEMERRKCAKNVYMVVCGAFFFILIPLEQAGYGKGWFQELVIGFTGGSLLSYVAFCARHRVRFFADIEFEWYEWGTPAVLVGVGFLLVVGILWSVAQGEQSFVILGVLLAAPIFQATVESWWDKKQEVVLLKSIDAQIDMKISKALASHQNSSEARECKGSDNTVAGGVKEA